MDNPKKRKPWVPPLAIYGENPNQTKPLARVMELTVNEIEPSTQRKNVLITMPDTTK